MTFFKKFFLFIKFFLFCLPVWGLIFLCLNSSIFWTEGINDLFTFSNYIQFILFELLKNFPVLILLSIYYYLFKNLFMYSIKYYCIEFLFSLQDRCKYSS